MTLAKGARQLVVQEALLFTETHMLSLMRSGESRQSPAQINLEETFILPDNRHGGGIVFVLIDAHDKHGGIR